MLPAHVTRESYEKPVVARNTADDEAINADMCVFVPHTVNKILDQRAIKHSLQKGVER